jgi:hypothetical protein
MHLGDGFHEWVQTGCAVIQTAAIAGGVVFAVIQVLGQEWDQHQRQIEATMAHLQELNAEPGR